ncbi:MAG TPA: SDR family oxidoreductase [Bacilli bacterium]|nr:SDR family oxidoreductase [Bacilli bacterium]HQD91854.1 SDR family oxidoreductase [Bacilli bacterium]
MKKDLILITGATGGMGYEAALHFGKDSRLLLLDVDEEKLKNLQKEIGPHASYIKFDITKGEDIEKVKTFVEQAGGFKHLIHFAGVSESMGNSELIYKINLIGTKVLLNALYDLIVPGGVVINTSSITAHMTPLVEGVDKLLKDPLAEDFLPNILKLTETTNQAYGWSKLGVVELSKIEAMRWGKKHARIVSISPGAIRTPMVEKEMEKNAESINQLIALTPVGRIGETSDIVNLVSFLVSDKASFISGIDIIIDGGVVEVFKSFMQ